VASTEHKVFMNKNQNTYVWEQLS